MAKDKKDSKQGRPLKPDHGNKRLQHKREAWRKASKKYYDNKKKDKKSTQKTRGRKK